MEDRNETIGGDPEKRIAHDLRHIFIHTSIGEIEIYNDTFGAHPSYGICKIVYIQHTGRNFFQCTGYLDAKCQK